MSCRRCRCPSYLALTLAAYVGEEVTIRYDPRDLAEIRVFHHHGTFLWRGGVLRVGRGQHQPQRPRTDAEALLTIVRITGGNFRLIERLMSQVLRVMNINQLDAITPDVIEAACETLVVGT